jgi:hypothetical protein
MVDNLPLSSADVTESGSLNLPEISGPHTPVMGLLYEYLTSLSYVSEDFSLGLVHKTLSDIQQGYLLFVVY